MATIYRCDRCKTEFPRREEIRSIELPHMSNRHGAAFTDETEGFTKELCGSCMRLVVDLINDSELVLRKKDIR